jgi:hypothetical protein
MCSDMDNYFEAYGLLDPAIEFGFTMCRYTLRHQFDNLKNEETFNDLVTLMSKKVKYKSQSKF